MNLKQEWLTFLCAVQFLTRIPITTDIDYNETRLNQAVGYYPLVGGLIGASAFFVFWISSLVLPFSVSAILSMAFSLLLTGAFHEDGFADMCDGIGGGRDKDHSLEIMRDSRLGTYGVAGLVIVLVLKYALLVSLAESSSSFYLFFVFVLSHVLSRMSAVSVIASSQYVRSEGTAKPVADGLDKQARNIALLSSSIFFILFCLATSWLLGLYALAFITAGHLAARRVFEKKLGGYTGDCLGAVQQISELSFLVGYAAWLYSF